MAFIKFPWSGQKEKEAGGGKAPRRSRVAAQAESIEAMRRRARHRLIGAAVLVVVGVAGFTMLFDTKPRPVPVNVPIDIPDRNNVAPLVVPGTPGAAQQPATASRPRDDGLDDGEEIVTSRPKPATTPVPAPVPVPIPVPTPQPSTPAVSKPTQPPAFVERKPEAAKPDTRSEPKPEPKPEPKREVKPEPKPASKPEPKPEHKPEPKPAPRDDDAARARALLEGRSAPAAAAPAAAKEQTANFIVQVGAFADADKAREVRGKLEGAGLKAFTQTIDTKDGKRTRVRVGPFGSRADADKAAGRIKSLGLPASVIPV